MFLSLFLLLFLRKRSLSQLLVSVIDDSIKRPFKCPKAGCKSSYSRAVSFIGFYSALAFWVLFLWTAKFWGFFDLTFVFQ